MERNELIKVLESSFLTEWKKLADTPYIGSLTELENYFLIDNILYTVNRRIYEGNFSAVRYQKYVLRQLAQQFARALFYVVYGESTIRVEIKIDEREIMRAQTILKVMSKCNIYPCIKE